MTRVVLALVSVAVILSSNVSVSANSCQDGMTSTDVAYLDTRLVDEASGLALAPGGGFFVTNDSGDSPRFFRLSKTGSNLSEPVSEIAFKDWKPFDVEALRVGPCPGELSGDCVAIADIGDNRERRKHVEVAYFTIDAIDRMKTLKRGAQVALKPDRVVRWTYPDRPHNAEGFAILSKSQLLIATKEQDRKAKKAQAARLYTVDVRDGKTGATPATGAATVAKFVGEWAVPDWLKDRGLGGLVTDIDVDAGVSGSDRIRVLILTYSTAVEVTAFWTLGQLVAENRRVFRIDPLEQQEAIAYDEAKTGFYFTSEAPLSALNWLRSESQTRTPIRYVRPDSCGGKKP